MDVDVKRNKHLVEGDKPSQKEVRKELNVLDKSKPKVEDENEKNEDDEELPTNEQTCVEVNRPLSLHIDNLGTIYGIQQKRKFKSPQKKVKKKVNQQMQVLQ